ncbi:hypothetical protein BSLA_02f0602 [Burkholderia stabilis]|nr:hypothetical protein BSLA_02f0602 [Burkholderia stabilis]
MEKRASILETSTGLRVERIVDVNWVEGVAAARMRVFAAAWRICRARLTNPFRSMAWCR